MSPKQTPGPKPPWLRVRLPSGRTAARVRALKQGKRLHTVCEEAACPNIGDCWGHGTATFLILGARCTRDCRFCNISPGPGQPVDWGEPERVAQAVEAMGLGHAVVTSVTRDDLPDGGAGVFAETIRQIRLRRTGCTIEVLVPDFRGDPEALSRVTAARPEVFNHNVETVPRLYPHIRPQAVYTRSLELLKQAKTLAPEILTKSGFMVGLGEVQEEILQVLLDLRQAGCDMVTIGQYLRPSPDHAPVVRYYSPEEFDALKQEARRLGFLRVESGPLVRSSYHAHCPSPAA